MCKHLIAVTALCGLIATLSSTSLRADDKYGPKIRPSLGLAVFEDVDSGKVIVDRVVPDGPADRAGLREGDLILKVDDREVANGHGVLDALAKKQPGDTITFQIKRDGESRSFKVTLGECKPMRNSDDALRRSRMAEGYRRQADNGYYDERRDMDDRDIDVIPIEEARGRFYRYVRVFRDQGSIVLEVPTDSIVEPVRRPETLFIRVHDAYPRETRIIERDDWRIPPREEIRVREFRRGERKDVSIRAEVKESNSQGAVYGALSQVKSLEKENTMDRVERLSLRLDDLDLRVRMMERQVDEVFDLLRR